MDPFDARAGALFPRRRSVRSLRVGLEHELLTVDHETGGAVGIQRVRAATHGAPYTPFLGFEPGGQVELSLPCAPTPRQSIADLARILTTLRADCDRAGIGLTATAVDARPGSGPGLQLTSTRYVAMQTHFDRIGPAGRRMMRRTASTQVCLDWWPGRAGLEQWHLLNLAGPFLSAVFAQVAGPGSRLATWLAVDPSRTAFDDRLIRDGDPVTAYADFARHATWFLESGDVGQHLTTLFPPVRPRGHYLEVRFPDVQEEAGIAALTAVLTTLAFDDGCRAAALRMLTAERPRLAERWAASAAGDPEVYGLGVDLVALAASAAQRAPLGYLPLREAEELQWGGAA